MNKTTNYLNHIAIDPYYYDRNYENDLPSETWTSYAKRTTLIALPFLSLYKPFGNLLSIFLGSCRGITHFWQALISKNYKEASVQMIQAALAVVALAGTLLNLTLGLIVTSGVDLITSLSRCMESLIQKDYESACGECLQILSSSFYIAVLCTGNLEIIFISLLIQVIISLYQARHELIAGKYPEWAAKIIMGIIRCTQAKGVYTQIQRRNYLFSLKSLEEVRQRIDRARQVNHLYDSSLENLDIKEMILTDGQGIDHDFGTHVHGYGKGVVKGANLTWRTQMIDGKKITELEFKVNHVFREHLEKLLQDTQKLSSQELKEILGFSHSHFQEISMQTVENAISTESYEVFKIDYKGLGTLFIGASRDYPNLFDKVTVRLDEGKNLYHLHEMLSFVNLDEVLRTSTPEDLERLKVGHLFRTFFPKEAFPLERSELYFNLPVEELKQEICSRVPEMNNVFKNSLSTMKPYEILPGRVRYTIPGLAENAKNLGARALTAVLTGDSSTQEMFDQTASIIKMGLLSSETRFSHQMFVEGASSGLDFFYGSADSVFTQMVSQNDMKIKRNFMWNGDIRFLFSLDLLETGTYQYYSDSFGERKPHVEYTSYTERPGILNFIENRNTYFHSSNEVMIKERIPPSMIQGIVVQDKSTYHSLVTDLRSRDLIQKDSIGNETILGVALEQFIHIGNIIPPEMMV